MFCEFKYRQNILTISSVKLELCGDTGGTVEALKGSSNADLLSIHPEVS